MASGDLQRKYVADRIDTFLPGSGEATEDLLYKRVCASLRGQAGWDFYDFRKMYKRIVVRFLENLSYGESSLCDALSRQKMTVMEALELDHRLWEAGLWKDLQLSDDDDQEIVHEGMYPCGYCKRKKLYALNTTDYAKQIRSADEPMTVFLHCHTCGKDYKFSS